MKRESIRGTLGKAFIHYSKNRWGSQRKDDACPVELGENLLAWEEEVTFDIGG